MNKKTFQLAGATIVILYFVLHLASLTKFPVFADEAIYIRWAQLIIDDPGQYLFFALNDGKTPLFIWLMAPFQYLFSDALLAGRLVSVLVGATQVFVVGLILSELKVRRAGILLGMLLTTVLPYWFIHHRLALMDGLLVLSASIAYLGVLKLLSPTSATTHQKSGLVLLGVGFGLSLWSKLPAVLLVPVFYLPLIFAEKPSLEVFKRGFMRITAGLILGLGLFALLGLHPAFGQLFSRGGDFLFSPKEALLAGVWRETLASLPTYASYFYHYLTIPLILIIIFGLFSKNHQRRTHLLFWSGVLFVFPIALLGKVVFARYLIPAALFFTLAGVSAAESLITLSKEGTKKNIALIGVLALLLANSISTSAQFAFTHLFHPDNTAFVSSDREQYLESWSSGHGIKEVVGLILQNQDKKIAIATEGYFGTLPDGLNMYLFDQDVSNLSVEGIGQPVSDIPEQFLERTKNFDQAWLVVNSNRLRMKPPEESLIEEYCRPNNAPCLQVWDISHLVE